MEKARTLLTYHDLTVEVESSPNDELLEHMHSTVMGQPGGFRYQHTNLVDRINSPGENYFMYLRKGEKMIGSVGFCGKPSETEGISYDSWLIRYFSIKAPLRAVPKKRKEQEDQKEENKRSSVLVRFIEPVLADPSQLRESAQEPGQPAIIYGVVEQKNLRSINIGTQLGLETVGQLAGFSFSRLRPERSDRVEQLSMEEQGTMLTILKEYYRDYTLFFSDPLFKNDDYYVIKESGRVVAGIQIYHVTWRIVDFGNGMANWVVRLLTKIPWFKKRFDMEQLKLLAFDGIYCEEGFEIALYELMEGVLERTGIYLAMLMMDMDSDIYRVFKEGKKLGILNKILGSFYGDIRARFINMPDEVRQYFLKHPTYIPTYDSS